MPIGIQLLKLQNVFSCLSITNLLVRYLWTDIVTILWKHSRSRIGQIKLIIITLYGCSRSATLVPCVSPSTEMAWLWKISRTVELEDSLALSCTFKAPATEFVLSLLSCNYKKGWTSSCGCQKAGLKCAAIYGYCQSIRWVDFFIQ